MRSGFFTTVAISVMEIDEVLVARMQSGRVMSARSLKSFF
jgi:hypothetical protein